MKKYSTIFFAFFYLIVSTGLAVNVHYCSGVARCLEVSVVDDSCCCDDGENNNSCCSNETFFLKFDNDQQLASDTRIALQPMSFLSAESTETVVVQKEKSDGLLRNSKFARSRRVKSWLENCSLIFYG